MSSESTCSRSGRPWREQAESLQAEAESLTIDREPGDVQFDEESGEGDTLAVERDCDLALAAQARQTIEEIDAALEQITKGAYGICECPASRSRRSASRRSLGTRAGRVQDSAASADAGCAGGR